MFACSPDDSAAIEAKEARHSKALGSSDVVQVPKPSEKTKAILESRGVTFGKKVDDVLVQAKLPRGWMIKRKAEDPRHIELVDDEQTTQACIFLKNSGYDYYGSINAVN